MTSVTCVMCGSLRDKTRVRLLVAANYTLKQVSYTPLLVNDTHLFKDQLSLLEPSSNIHIHFIVWLGQFSTGMYTFITS